MKRLIAFILITVLTLGCMNVFVAADEQPQGTAITDVYGLMDIAKDPDGDYYLANDILISGDYISPELFTGTFDGCGHSIVLDGAKVKGGIFSYLDGGILKNVKIVAGTNENKFSAKVDRYITNTTRYYFGALVDTGRGTIENVVNYVDIDINLDLDGGIGGIVGAISGGDLTVKNCVNVGDITGKKYSGGIVASAHDATEAGLTIENCINYGDITSGNSGAGIFGHNNNGSCLTTKLISCINYGTIVCTSSNQAAGICAYTKAASVRAAEKGAGLDVLNCVNYGMISTTASGAQLSAIYGRNNNENGETLNIKGNLNYAALTLPESGCNGMVAVFAYGNNLTTDEETGAYLTLHLENNYTVDFVQSDSKNGDNSATPTGGQGEVFDANTFTTLNEAFPDTYAEKDGKIVLKWANDAGYTETAPTAPTYTVDGQSEIVEREDNSGENGDTNGEDETTRPAAETRPSTNTSDTSSNGTSDTNEKKSSGCSSTLGGASAVALMLVSVFGNAIVMRKKK